MAKLPVFPEEDEAPTTQIDLGEKIALIGFLSVMVMFLSNAGVSHLQKA